MTYEAAIQLIKQKQSLGVQPGLSRMLAAMEKTGSVQNKLQVIHVAGTNGKGTVCAAVADGLYRAGYRVGVFSSPWVTDFREQITVDGRMISKQDFADCVKVFAKEPLTEFELITAVMYLYFYRCGVDYAVVECGMGGAGDCTNVLAHPAVCAFAKVALDHTAFLGDTVEAIAREKSGIIKPGCPVVLYPHIAAKDVFLEQCRALHCPVTEAAEQGDPIADDLAVAGEVLRLLGVDTTPGLPMLPARREHFGENLLLDGAHNPDGAAALLLHLRLRLNDHALFCRFCRWDNIGKLRGLISFLTSDFRFQLGLIGNAHRLGLRCLFRDGSAFVCLCYFFAQFRIRLRFDLF